MTDAAFDMDLIVNRLDDLARQLDGRVCSPWLTTSETARYLKCSTRQIERLARRGLLPYSRQDPTSPKSRRLYFRRHLDTYLLLGRNPQTRRLSPAEKRLVEELL